MDRGPKKSSLDFEKSIKKLEEIVQRLEDDQVPLEESLKLFAKGKKLARACEASLQEAENRVRRLMEDDKGDLSETPFEGGGATDDEAAETRDED